VDTELKAMLWISALFVTLVGGATWAWSSYSCHAKWRDSGMPVDFGLMSGCRISEDGGKTWIPEERWRQVN
jgi:hypothetical protein